MYPHIKEETPMEKLNAFFRRLNPKKCLTDLAAIIAAVLVMYVLFLNAKTVTVDKNGDKTNFITFSSTVGQVLKTNNFILNPKDKVYPSLTSMLTKKQVIYIKPAVDVNVLVDGKTLKIKSAENDVGLMLIAEGILLGSEDRVKPGMDVKLSDGMNVEVVRVKTRFVSEIQPVDFKETVKYDSSIANTKRSLLHDGTKGEKKVTYAVVYENGAETSRKIVGEYITKNPADRVILQGTYPLVPVSRGGTILPYSKKVRVKSTAYWAVNGVGSTYTASGRKAVRNPEGYSTIAVDRSLIPYGTKLFVEGYGFAIAADTGSGIKGNKIDVYFNTYREACNWGAKYVNMYILQ